MRIKERHRTWLQLHALDDEPQEQRVPVHGDQWEWVAVKIVHFRAAEVVFGQTSLSVGSMRGKGSGETVLIYDLRGARVQPRRSLPKLYRSRGHPSIQVRESRGRSR